MIHECRLSLHSPYISPTGTGRRARASFDRELRPEVARSLRGSCTVHGNGACRLASWSANEDIDASLWSTRPARTSQMEQGIMRATATPPPANSRLRESPDQPHQPTPPTLL